MADISPRLNSPPHPDHLSFTDSEADASSNDSDVNFTLVFPRPPPMSRVLARMPSWPRYPQPLAAYPKPERRHSASPLIPHPYGPPQPQPHKEPRYSPNTSKLLEYDHSRETAGGAPLAHEILNRLEQASETCQFQAPPINQETVRRLEPLPPPASAPSAPLPRLPRTIRKAASVRLDPKRKPTESPTSSLGPAPKIKSPEFISGPADFGGTTTQLHEHEEKKHDLPFSQPNMVSRVAGSLRTGWDASTSNRSNYASYNQTALGHASPLAYSNPLFVRNTTDQHTSNITVKQRRQFDLSKGNMSSNPPFTCRVTNSNPGILHRRLDNSCIDGMVLKHGMSPGESGTCTRPGYPAALQRPPHSFDAGNGSKNGNANSGTPLQSAASFIDIKPERRKHGRRRSKSRSGIPGFGNEKGTIEHQVGSSMKQKGEKVRRLVARASSSVVDWGRQLTGRTAKPTATSSASGSLASGSLASGSLASGNLASGSLAPLTGW